MINVLNRATESSANFCRTAILFAPLTSIFAELTVGESYQINLPDVDGNTFSTADGRITTLVLISESNIDKERAVGDRTPDLCLANPTYRMITVWRLKRNTANRSA